MYVPISFFFTFQTHDWLHFVIMRFLKGGCELIIIINQDILTGPHKVYH